MYRFFKKTMLVVAIGMYLTSCRNDSRNDVEPSTSLLTHQELSVAELDERRVEFAKILAKAMVNENVRQLIKMEAANQFDADYDVLFWKIKDQEVASGSSMFDYLASFASSKEEFSELVESLPLLTIFVPKLSKFSVEDWDIQSQVPLVTVVNSGLSKTNSKLRAFNSGGAEIELDNLVEPAEPVIVVKENERLVTVDKNSNARIGSTITAEGSLYYARGEVEFYFIDDVYNQKEYPQATQESRAARVECPRCPPTPSDYPFARKLVEASQKTMNYDNVYFQRDYVYYDIFPPEGKNQGPLNKTFGEAIAGFEMSRFENFNDIGGWTEGNFEFEFYFTLGNASGAVTPPIMQKFTVRPDELFDFTARVTRYYRVPEHLLARIAEWDLQKYGDTWFVKIKEFDPSQKRIEERKFASGFAINFQMDVTGGQIVKIGNGAKYDRTVEQTSRIETTTESDNLGDILFSFHNKPLSSVYDSRSGGYITSQNMYSTGTVRVAIRPFVFF